jgi:hypothetical protein
MIRHVAFEDLNEQHLSWIAESILVPPPEMRVEAADFLRAIQQEGMRLFDWEDGCCVVGVRDGRLVLFAFCCHNLIKRLPVLVADMQRLATEWQCHAIETTCFNRQLTSAIQKLGASVESTTLVLPVESDNGC